MNRAPTILAVVVVAVIAALVAGAASCGSDSLSFCVEEAKASCQLQFRCCTAVERSAQFGQTILFVGPYADESGCVDAFTRQCQAFSQAQDEEIAAKRITFDNTKANKCLDDQRKAATDCDASGFFNPDDNCRNLVTGNVADGDVCTADSECKEPTSQCAVDNTPAGSTDFVVPLNGKCKGQGNAGEPCLAGEACTGDLRCVRDQNTGEQSCQPPTAAGGACQGDTDCADGLHCIFNTGSGLCTAPGDVDAACSSDVDCRAGLRCLQDQQTFANQCAVPGGLGVSCFQNTDCSVGLLCANDRCATTSGAGEDCAGGAAQCQPGLDCRSDFTTSLSQCFAGVAGDPCQNGERCQAGLSCKNDPIAGFNKCQAAGALNSNCDEFSHDECVSPLRCRNDGSFNFKCLQPLAANAACSSSSSGDDPCDGTHNCAFDSVSGNDLCLASGGAGTSCSSDVECNSGLFCDQLNTGTCIGLHSAGQSCQATSQCAAGLSCRDNDAQTSQICRGLSAANERCTSNNDCAAGLDCRSDDAGQRTVCRGASTDGQRCESFGDCAQGLDCRNADDGASTVCRGLSNADEGCDGALDCADGLACRVDNTTFRTVCKGPAVAGDACSVDGDCITGLVCRFDNNTGTQKCTTLGAEGAICSSDTDCTPGLRCLSVVDAVVCTSLLQDGDSCSADAECISGFCDPDNQSCKEKPPKEKFEICNGL